MGASTTARVTSTTTRVAHADRSRAGWLRPFARDERGVAAVEFALILPLLLGLLTGGIVMWDAFRFAETTERSAYTVADLASRQLVAGPGVMGDLHDTHVALLDGRTNDVWTRIASVEVYTIREDDPATAADETILGQRVAWHWESGVRQMTQPTNLDLSDMPLVGSGDSILLIETRVRKPDFMETLHAGPREYGGRNWVRPRYVGQMVWN